MAPPKNALKVSQLHKLTEGSAIKDGSHDICKVKVIIDGHERIGYFKKLDPKNHYPALLGKISVAVSVFKRTILGSRTAEERLVFDDNDVLQGTLSLSLDKFKSFYNKEQLEKVPIKDSKDKELLIPNTETLIKHNIIEFLLTRWFLHDDDVHPGNIGVEGDIDNDMALYPVTGEMKGWRPGIGVTNTGPNLTVSDYETFPNLTNSTKPYHWPTFTHPGQISIPTVVPAQGQILSNTLPKAYVDPKQFENLAREPEAQKQKVAAALKILLTYQPDVMRKRLMEYLGDLPLNYTSLDEKDPTLRATYERNFRQYFNNKTNEKPFVDFLMSLYQEYYDNMYRVVVFYMGCKKLGLSSTADELFFTPSHFSKIVEWVEKENESYKEGLKLDRVELNRRYHQVWRDAYAPSVQTLVQKSHALTLKVINLALKDADTSSKFNPLSFKEATDASITDTSQLFGSISLLPEPEEVLEQLKVDKNSEYRKAVEFLIRHTNKLSAAAKKYYSLDRKDLTEQANLEFITALQPLVARGVDSMELNIRQSLSHTTSLAQEYSTIVNDLRNLTNHVDFAVHLTTKDEHMQGIRTSCVPEVAALDNIGVINSFNQSLFAWAKSLSSADFTHFVEAIVKEKYQSTMSNRHRSGPVLSYLEQSRNEPNDVRLAYILTSGTEAKGALNTLLIQHLTPKLMQSKFAVPTASYAVNDNSFFADANLKTYTEAAVLYANQTYLTHSTARGKQLFFDSIYTWIGDLDRTVFERLKERSLCEYEQGLSKFRYVFSAFSAISESRRGEVESYRFPSQSKIVAFIFLHGEVGSSLNKILFRDIITAMQLDYKKRPEKQSTPEYKLITSFDPDQHETMYLGLLKKYAEGPSNQQLLKAAV